MEKKKSIECQGSPKECLLQQGPCLPHCERRNILYYVGFGLLIGIIFVFVWLIKKKLIKN